MTPAELRAWRRRLGLTQRQLGVALGLADTVGTGVTVSRWETGIYPFAPFLPLALRALEAEHHGRATIGRLPADTQR